MLSIISHTTAYAGEVGNSWGILQFDFSNLRNLTPISQGGGSYYYSADFPLPGEDVGIYAKALPEKWGTSQTLWVVVPGATNAPDDFKDVKCNFNEAGELLECEPKKDPPEPYPLETAFTSPYMPTVTSFGAMSCALSIGFAQALKFGDQPDNRIVVSVFNNACGDLSALPALFGELLDLTIEFDDFMNQGPDEAPSPFGEDRGPGYGPGKCSLNGLPTYRVNTATLNLVVTDTDYQYGSIGPGVKLTRTWNANPAVSGLFGPGWRFAYESEIKASCSGAFLSLGTGQTFSWTIPKASCPNGNLIAPFIAVNQGGVGAGKFDTLSYNSDDSWSYKEKSTQLIYRYEKVNGRYLLASVSDRNNNKITLEYNANSQLTKLKDAVGRVTTVEYNLSGKVSKFVVPDGRFAEFKYDLNGYLINTIDLLGTKFSYLYDNDGYLTFIGASGRNAYFTWDDSGGWKHVSTITNANGEVSTYSGLMQLGTKSTSIIKPNDERVNYQVLANGETPIKTNSQGQTIFRDYKNNQLTSFTDASGNTTKYEYDERGNPLKVIDPLGQITSYIYDSDDNLVRVTNALGDIQEFVYDANGNLLSEKTPLGRYRKYNYDERGLLTALTDYNNKETRYVYNALGNLTNIIDPLGNETLIGYDSLGLHKVSQTDPQGNTRTFEYDENDRLIRDTNPDGSFTTYGYDACSLISLTDENGHITTYSYDGLLNLTTVTDPNNYTSFRGYDEDNNLVSVTDPLGRIITHNYDGLGRRISTTNTMGGIQKNDLDDKWNLTKSVSPNDVIAQFAWDEKGQLVSELSDEIDIRYYEYDSLGRLTTFKNSRGHTVSWNYDSDGRKTSKSYDGIPQVNLDYDEMSNIASFTDSLGTTSYERDAIDRITQIIYSDGTRALFEYDMAGNISQIDYPGGVSVHYQYDKNNYISQLDWNAGWIKFSYDPSGNLVTESISNGISSLYEYDANNNITHLRYKSGSTILTEVSYTRDPVGNVIFENSRLPLESTLKIGVKSGSYLGDQLVNWNGNPYVYDADGNLITVGGEKPLTANYDLENRIIELTRSGQTVQYTYNGVGSREKTMMSGSTRRYHYDHQGRLLFETSDAGIVTAWYFYSQQGLVAMRTSSHENRFYHFDAIGSTLMLTDDNSNMVASYAYEPYGRIVAQTGNQYNPFTYIGRVGVMDEGDGLYFMVNRFYDATTGRFINRDPIGISGGTNAYLYALANPINYTDPKGLATDEAQGSRSDPDFCVNSRKTFPDDLVKRMKQQARRIDAALDLALSSSRLDEAWTFVKTYLWMYDNADKPEPEVQYDDVMWDIGKSTFGRLPGLIIDLIEGPEKLKDTSLEKKMDEMVRREYLFAPLSPK